MTDLETPLVRPSPIIPRWIVWSWLVFSFVGFLDATYLTVKHYTGGPINCSILNGCDKVATSSYAAVLGVPVALAGAVYYLFLFLLAVIYIDSSRARFFHLAVFTAFAGFLASLWFVYLQVFVLRALCLYCLFSAIDSTFLSLLGMVALRSKTKSDGYSDKEN